MRAATVVLAVLATAFVARADVVSYRAVEQWRTVEDESAPYLFGVIMGVAADSQGRIYALDTQLQELHRFTADGDYDRLVCRSGQGPGELHQNYSVLVDADDRIVLPRAFPPSVTFVDHEGVYLESMVLVDGVGEAAFTMMPGRLHLTAGGVLAEGMDMDFTKPRGDESRILSTFHADGVLRAEIVRRTRQRDDFTADVIHRDERADFFPGARRAVSRDGRIFLAMDRDLYRITVMDLDGEVTNVIERDILARKRTPEEMEERKNGYTMSSTGTQRLPDFDITIEPTEPPITNLTVVGDELFVRRDAPDLPDDAYGLFDVFDLDGTLLETRRIHVPHDREQDEVVMLDDGRLVVLENFRSALRASNAGTQVRVGESDVEEEIDDDDDAALNIVVHRLERG